MVHEAAPLEPGFKVSLSLGRFDEEPYVAKRHIQDGSEDLPPSEARGHYILNRRGKGVIVNFMEVYV